VAGPAAALRTGLAGEFKAYGRGLGLPDRRGFDGATSCG